MSGSTLRMWQQRSGFASQRFGPSTLVLLGDRDHLGDDQVEPVALDEPLARLVGLLEEEVRVELDDVDVEPELGDHVDEHGRLLLPGAREAEALAELLEGPARGPPRRQRLDLVRQSGRAAAGSQSRSSTSFSVSARSPRRSVSSGMTSSGGMLPRLTSGPNLLHEPGLRALLRRLEDDVGDVDLVDDLVDQAGAHLAGRPVDAGGAALAALGDHLPGAGVELLADPLDPLVRREDDLRVLRADLGEDDEVLGELGDQLELALAREVDRPVGDLDVREAVLGEPAPVLVELVRVRWRPRRASRRRRRASRTSGRARSSSRGCS